MKIKIEPSFLSGNIVAPPSKSDSHRALICASLAALQDGTLHEQNIKNIILSEDVLSTIRGVSALGIEIDTSGKNSRKIIIKNNVLTKNHVKGDTVIDCNESGSTLRFLIPVFAALGIDAVFTGKRKLPERPLAPYFECMSDKGISFDFNGTNTLPLRVSGKLKSGEYNIMGNISSQFISGLLFALPLLDGNSAIKIIGKLESKPYVDMTVSTLKKFGINIECCEDGYFIKGRQRYRKSDYAVEGDFSQAAFFAVGAVLGKENSCVKIMGLNRETKQGDIEIFNIIDRCGGKVVFTGNEVEIYGSQLESFDIHATNIPDLVPILAVLAASCSGKSHILEAGRLKIKESDRLKTITKCLRTLEINIDDSGESLEIKGTKKWSGGEIYSHNDHRIAMAVAIAALNCNAPVILSGAECVNKSYPGFWEDYKSLGGIINVIDMA